MQIDTQLHGPVAVLWRSKDAVINHRQRSSHPFQTKFDHFNRDSLHTAVHRPQASWPCFRESQWAIIDISSPGDNSLYKHHTRPASRKPWQDYGTSSWMVLPDTKNRDDEAFRRSCSGLLAAHNAVFDAGTGKYIVATNDIENRINYDR